MTYQALARKWRPKAFQQLVGQQHVVQALVNGLDQNRLHHAFLFSGTRGVGKTTIARILAKCLNCEIGVSSRPCGACPSCIDIDEGRFVDMIEIDAASRTGIDDTRELLESVQYTPTRGRYKVYIIDEVHMLSSSSFNALLKTLEEPPPHVKFVLATTDPEKIPVTILSRCLQFSLKRLSPEEIRSNLAAIVEQENLEAEPGALVLLARAADGSMRDGLSLLDQAIAYGGGQLTATHVEAMLGIVDRDHVFGMIELLAQGNAAGLMAIVEELIAKSRDLDAVLVRIAEGLHRICLLQAIPEYRDEERSDWDRIEALASTLPAEDAQLYYQIAIRGRTDLGLAPDPRTGLEMTLLRMLAFRPPGQVSAAAGAGGAGNEAGDSKREAGSSSRTHKRVAKTTPRQGTRQSVMPMERLADPASSVPADTRAPGQAGRAPQPGQIDWLTFAGDLRLQGQVRELARHLHLHGCRDDQWEFAISPSLRHLGSETCVHHLSQAISDYLGKPVGVRLVDSGGEDLQTAARVEEQQLRLRMTEAERSIDRDPTVRALQEQMGARITNDSIQPVQ